MTHGVWRYPFYSVGVICIFGNNGMIKFRQEALEHLKNKQYGEVFINAPMHYVSVGIALILLFVIVCVYCCFAEMRERTIVKGVLNSNKGVVHVYSKRSGIIIKQWVKQGDSVTKGTPLFLIDTSLDRWAPHKNQRMLGTFTKRAKALDEDIRYKVHQLKTLKPLVLKHYISSDTYREKHDELVALKTKKNLLTMEYIEYKQSRTHMIRAPIDGFISSLTSTLGQSTQSLKPLATILPEGAFLLAELFVPVRQVRFLKLKQPVSIRYDAYPYQHFGTGHAQLFEISQTVLTDALEEKSVSVGEPYYKARAYLNKLILLDKQKKALKPGMTFSAEILGNQQTIGRWLFETLYGYRQERLL